MKDSQLEEGDLGARGESREIRTREGPSSPLAQLIHLYSRPSFRNLRVLRTLMREHDKKTRLEHLRKDSHAGGMTYASMVQRVKTNADSATRNWFDDLDPKSVDTSEELSHKFLEEFSQQKKHVKDLTEIHTIRRKPNKGP
ncbi:hypothetical protein Tco_0027315 [Tanacetum coccineum]